MIRRCRCPVCGQRYFCRFFHWKRACPADFTAKWWWERA